MIAVSENHIFMKKIVFCHEKKEGEKRDTNQIYYIHNHIERGIRGSKIHKSPPKNKPKQNLKDIVVGVVFCLFFLKYSFFSLTMP